MISKNCLARLILVLLLVGTLVTPSLAAGNRNILLDIVTNCLDPSVADYDKVCRWPREGSPAACRATTKVWETTRDFVVLRDRKMCACTDDKSFFHALAIPRFKVTGAEDPNRPVGIWQFAWDSAVRHMGKEDEIALVVNPPGLLNRSQDQLHLHLVRLNAVGRTLAAASTTGVKSLDQVWQRAAELARGKYTTYGVLVAKNAMGGFFVLVDDSNLEHAYTQYRCP